MSISIYAELKTAASNWLHRDDLTDRIPEFISLAEARIANDVRCKAQETRSTATINTEYFDIPDDFLEIRDVSINSDPNQPLTFLTPKVLSEKFPSSVTGKPRFYTLHGDEFQVKPVPSGDYTIEISYFARFAAFSADADTNWLLTNHPDIYLYAAMLSAGPFLEDDQMITRYMNAYTASVGQLNAAEEKGKYGDTLSIRVNTATP